MTERLKVIEDQEIETDIQVLGRGATAPWR
jgi:hypothetical protein